MHICGLCDVSRDFCDLSRSKGFQLGVFHSSHESYDYIMLGRSTGVLKRSRGSSYMLLSSLSIFLPFLPFLPSNQDGF